MYIYNLELSNINPQQLEKELLQVLENDTACQYGLKETNIIGEEIYDFKIHFFTLTEKNSNIYSGDYIINNVDEVTGDVTQLFDSTKVIDFTIIESNIQTVISNHFPVLIAQPKSKIELLQEQIELLQEQIDFLIMSQLGGI